MTTRFFTVCVLTLCVLTASAWADNWPQWRGPERTGLSKETGLLREWPKAGPKLMWERKDIGGGYSTPAVVDDRLYLMADRKGEEFVIALAVKDGTEVWATAVGKVGPNKGPQYPGTRSTPTVDGERIYALGSDGDLACLEKDKGKLVWSKNLRKAFDGTPGAWAYSESVLIDGDRLICTPGGKKATMVTLRKKDGQTVWKCAIPQGDAAGYASPIVVEVGGVRQYVQFVGGGLVGVDAKTGKFLWRYDKTKDPAANIPTPVFHDGCVFSSTSRNGTGLNRIKVSEGEVSSEQVYFNTTKLNSIGGVVRVGNYIYGTERAGRPGLHGFQDGRVEVASRLGRGRHRCATPTACFTCVARVEAASARKVRCGWRSSRRHRTATRRKGAWSSRIMGNAPPGRTRWWPTGVFTYATEPFCCVTT